MIIVSNNIPQSLIDINLDDYKKTVEAMGGITVIIEPEVSADKLMEGVIVIREPEVSIEKFMDNFSQ